MVTDPSAAKARIVHRCQLDDLAGLGPHEGNLGGQRAGDVLAVLRGAQSDHGLEQGTEPIEQPLSP